MNGKPGDEKSAEDAYHQNQGPPSNHLTDDALNSREGTGPSKDAGGNLHPESAAASTASRRRSGDAHSTTSTNRDSDHDEDDDGLSRVSTHASMGPDGVAEVEQYSSFVEVPDEVYDRFSRRRKLLIVAVLSFCSFLAPMASTTVLSAVPEVAAEYDTTGTIINLSNALYSGCFFFFLFSFLYANEFLFCGSQCVFLELSVPTDLFCVKKCCSWACRPCFGAL